MSSILFLIFLSHCVVLDALKCYSGEKSGSVWIRDITEVPCRKSSFWCVMKHEQDNELRIDRWIYGCTTPALCKEMAQHKINNATNNNEISSFKTNLRTSTYHMCCRTDLCNISSSSRALFILIFVIIVIQCIFLDPL